MEVRWRRGGGGLTSKKGREVDSQFCLDQKVHLGGDSSFISSLGYRIYKNVNEKVRSLSGKRGRGKRGGKLTSNRRLPTPSPTLATPLYTPLRVLVYLVDLLLPMSTSAPSEADSSSLESIVPPPPSAEATHAPGPLPSPPLSLLHPQKDVKVASTSHKALARPLNSILFFDPTSEQAAKLSADLLVRFPPLPGELILVFPPLLY